jgi:phosphohistidine phosphatase
MVFGDNKKGILGHRMKAVQSISKFIFGGMMRLYLVQHGESVPEETDPNRPLTEKGRADVFKAARFLRDAGIKIDVIWHSTKLRAKQTAQLIAEAVLPRKGMLEKTGLAPNDPVDKMKEEILKDNQENVMLVGHLPFLGKLASLFLTDSESHHLIGFRQGGVVCLDQMDKGGWFIAWIAIPDLIPHSS